MEQLSLFNEENFVFNPLLELEQFLKDYNISVLEVYGHDCSNYFVSINDGQFSFRKKMDYNDTIYNSIKLNDLEETYFIDVTEDGKCYYQKLKINFNFEYETVIEWNYFLNKDIKKEVVKNIKIKDFIISKSKELTKLVTCYRCKQNINELKDILLKTNPYAYDLAIKKDWTLELLLAPHLEILYKAGFKFIDVAINEFKSTSHYSKKNLEYFNRLCQKGTNPKEIFKTTKAVYTLLKEEYSLEIWDSFRKLIKMGRITPDILNQLYYNGYSSNDLNSINSILNKTYNGKPVFTFNSLTNYLERLDMYEAIERKEAFMLLNDYLLMCQQLNVQPKIDGDSLKREHDVMARNCRLKKNEIMNQKLTKASSNYSKYNYEEDIYFVRTIEDYNDLLEEANQQHNCVASYAQSIVDGTRLVFVMREKKTPKRSLITIELSPDGKTIRQKFLAYNKPIHNKSQTEFLNRWLQYCRNQA